MAINFTSYLNAPTSESPWKNMFENVLKGYQMSKEPAKMAEEQKQREQANKLKELELEHKPKEYELNDKQQSLVNSMKQKALDTYDERWKVDKQIKEAQLKKAISPEVLKGALATAFKLRNNLDPNSPTYEQDKNKINKYIDKLGKNEGDISQSAPGQGIKINLPEGKEGYLPGMGKLKTGWQYVQDEKGNNIGVNVPLSEKQVDQWKAKEKFDIIYPFLNNSLSEYSGRNSWDRYTRDAHNYNKDPKAKQRIDNYFAAKKLVSIGSTTENARIGGHATNVQLRELKNSLDSSEVYKKLESGSGYVLPEKYAKFSGEIFKSYLDKVEKAAKNNIPAYEFRSLNPGQNNETNPDTNAPVIAGTINGITTIRNNGKTLKIPEALVDRYIQEHTKPAFGGQYE